MRVIDLISEHGRPLEENQVRNLERIRGISESFSDEAGIPAAGPVSSGDQTIVLESGHQPNFLPHAGFWKKIFLLECIGKDLRARGVNPVAVFGFADLNLSTAPVLYRNHVPACRKGGAQKVGFTLKDSRLTRFQEVAKPGQDRWDREMKAIRSFYTDAAKKAGDSSGNPEARLDAVLSIMEDCYRRASNFADLNAFIAARISTELLAIRGVAFFRYSDLQKEGIFLPEWERILGSIVPYNAAYNRAAGNPSQGIHSVPLNQVPFWYHCGCGGKVTLMLGEDGMATGSCPACGATHDIALGTGDAGLPAAFPRMSLSAVSRNLVVSAGLGTGLWISGAGGGLRYGAVANQVSAAMGLPVPVTLAWAGHDRYMGISQQIARAGLSRAFKLALPDIPDPSLPEKVRAHWSNLGDQLAALESGGGQPESIMRMRDRYRSTGNDAGIARDVFSLIPSFLDILVNADPPSIAASWDEAARAAVVTEVNGMQVMKGDTFYQVARGTPGAEEISMVYRNMASLPELA